MKTIFGVMTVLLLSLWGCQDYDLAATELASHDPTSLPASVALSSSRSFTDQQLATIAAYHNQYLGQVINQLSATGQVFFDWESLSTAIDAEVAGLAAAEGISLPAGVLPTIDRDLDAEQQALLATRSAAFQSLIQTSDQFMESPSASDVATIHTHTAQWRGVAHATLSGIELDAALGYFEVLDASAEFWFPTDLGGQGGGESMEDLVPLNQPLVDWGRVGRNDAHGGMKGIFRAYEESYGFALTDPWDVVQRIGLGAASASLMAAGISIIDTLFS
ncbi:MAG: hypothetical protein AAFQ98_05825 [Bacteroidota bacterium]